MHTIDESHYTFVENPNHPMTGVKFKKGEWKDVTVVYGTVGVEENITNDEAKLSFNYTILDPADFTIDELNEDEAFKNYLGDVLRYIITDSLDWGKENNLARIGIGESDTNTDTESPAE